MADAILAQSGIYAIRNIINGKVYVGSAVLLNRRFATHKRMLSTGKHHSQKLQRSWDKRGKDSFVFEVLAYVNESLLIESEQRFIDALDSCNSGYNICSVAGSTRGTKRSDVTRLKMSEWQKGIPTGPMHPCTKDKISAANKGKEKGKEWRDKLSKSHIGKVVGEETRRKLSEANLGSHRSEETKAKISASLKGRKKSDQERINMSLAQKGAKRNPLAEEHKIKISLANRGRKQTSESVAKRVASRRKTMMLKANTEHKPA